MRILTTDLSTCPPCAYHVKGSRVGSAHDIGGHAVSITARKVGNDAQSRLWGGWSA